jgi:hypothetical protein
MRKLDHQPSGEAFLNLVVDVDSVDEVLRLRSCWALELEFVVEATK